MDELEYNDDSVIEALGEILRLDDRLSKEDSELRGVSDGYRVTVVIAVGDIDMVTDTDTLPE